MNRKISINDKENTIRLRNAEQKDIELLRIWKNRNKRSFFYQQEITAEQQGNWFLVYQKRENDYIFIVEERVDEEYNPIGCLGFRVQEDAIDLYNIIRGRESKSGVSMHLAMDIMLNYIIQKYAQLPIKCDVLKDNPAVGWYQKCGFDILREIEYYVMQIDRNKIRELELTIYEEEAL